MGRRKGGSQIPAVKCLKRAVGNPLGSEQLSQCLCSDQPWLPWIQQGEGCSCCLPPENLLKSIIELLQAQASKSHWNRVSNTSLSTNNTATEIYVGFAIWFLFSKSENAEEFKSMLCPGFTAVGSLPCPLTAPCPWRHTSIRGIFSLNPLCLSRLWATCLWSCWWTPSQDLSLLLQSSWGGSLHYSSDMATVSWLCGLSLSVLFFASPKHILRVRTD